MGYDVVCEAEAKQTKNPHTTDFGLSMPMENHHQLVEKSAKLCCNKLQYPSILSSLRQ